MTKNKEGVVKPDPDKHSKNANNRINISGVLEKVLRDTNPESFEASLKQYWPDLSRDEKSRIEEHILQIMDDYDPRKPSGNRLIFDDWDKLHRKYFDVEIKTEDGKTVLLGKNYKTINPALDIHNDDLMMMIPLPTETYLKDRDGEVKKRTDIENFVITSSHKVFSASRNQFEKRGAIARIPEMVTPQRYSSEMIMGFLTDGIKDHPWEIIKTLRDTWNFFMDFGTNPGAAIANSIYCVLTYCYPLFSSIPYLRFTGEKGAAKTKGGQIHEQIDFNSLNAVNLSSASMFRMRQDTRGTIIIDEAESYGKNRNKSENQEALDQVINSGWQSSGKVPRIETVGNRRMSVNFSTFGPTIVCSIGNLTETLRDRSYEIVMVKTLDRERSRRTVRENDPRWQMIRDSIFLLIMNHWKEIRDIYDNAEIENRIDLIGREWDKAKPMLAIAQFFAKYGGKDGEALLDGLWDFLKDQHERESEVSMDSVEFSIIQGIEEMIMEDNQPKLVGSGKNRIALSDLAERVATLEGKNIEGDRFNKISYGKFVKDKIKKMGLARDFPHGTSNKVYFEIDISDVKTAKQRYGMENSSEGINSINSNNSINSINYINSDPKGISDVRVNREVVENTGSGEKSVNTVNVGGKDINSLGTTGNSGSRDTRVNVVNENRKSNGGDMIPSYKSPDLVLGNLKEGGFEVIEYEKVVMSQDEWKAKIKGTFADFTGDRQEYLDKMFDVRFRGSFNSPYVWIRFRVEALP